MKVDCAVLLGFIFCFSVMLATGFTTEDNWYALVILTEVGQAQKAAVNELGAKGNDGERN